MKKIYDITSWEKVTHEHTRGTRDKYIAIEPETGSRYYFKTSINRDKKNYPYEFWSEIIAFQLGDALGFEICPYYLAHDSEKIGCISKSIIDNDEVLFEGVNYISAIEPLFLENKNFKKMHNFELICRALKEEKVPHLIDKVIDMLVFDAIIGNSDRHSENWALIVRVSQEIKETEVAIYMIKDKIIIGKNKVNEMTSSYKYLAPYLIGKLYRVYYLFKSKKDEQTITDLENRFRRMTRLFSPIYDSGCSLARELTDEKMKEYLDNEEFMSRYHEKAIPDIKVDGSKINHFQLLDHLAVYNSKLFASIISRIKLNYSKERIEDIINNIDNDVPVQFDQYKLKSIRKKFIIKYICYRIEVIIRNYEQII